MSCTQGHALQSLGLTYIVPRRALQRNGVQRDSLRSGKEVHEGRAGEGSARAIPRRVVVGEEEEEQAFEPSPQEQHDHHVSGEILEPIGDHSQIVQSLQHISGHIFGH